MLIESISFYGKTNSGKSSLLNAIIGQEISIVSNLEGTTTDPVKKAIELIPYGPVLFIDTAGLADESELGSLRIERTLKTLQNTDFALYVLDIKDKDLSVYQDTIKLFKKFNIPYLTVINKIDTATEEEIEEAKKVHKDAVFVSASKEDNITFKR